MVYNLTQSQVMALCDILVAYLLQPEHTEVFHDVVHQIDTTPEELLQLFMDGQREDLTNG